MPRGAPSKAHACRASPAMDLRQQGCYHRRCRM